MNHKIKILQVATVNKTIEAFLLPYADKMKEEGWIVHAAANEASKNHAIKKHHDEVFDIDFCRNPLNVRGLIKSFIGVRKLIKNERYDIVHVHTPIAAFLTRFASAGLKETLVIYTAHGFHYIKGSHFIFKNFLFYLSEKMAGYFTDHLFVINDDDLKFALDKRLLEIDNITKINGVGVNISEYRRTEDTYELIRNEVGINQDDFCFIHIAELNENKNHQVVLKALAEIVKDNPIVKIKLLIVGVGNNESYLMRMVEDLKISNFVIFLGYKNNISELISSSNVLVLPSRREGLPRSIMESMCCERPVIASKIRGCKDLLSTGSGILLPVDDIIAWKNAMLELSISPKLCIKMGRIGLKTILESYEQDKVVSDVIDVYKKMLRVSNV